jgi:ATP-dependent helicase/DNAse subunit B
VFCQAWIQGHPIFSINQNGSEPKTEHLDETIARFLYSDSNTQPTLYTSVSRIEAFAECPFRFFVQSGLKAEERMAFELDARRLGSFQHAALEAFHMALEDEGLKMARPVTITGTRTHGTNYFTDDEGFPRGVDGRQAC